MGSSPIAPTMRLKAESVGLPPRIFLYTVDQIAVVLNVSELHVKRHVLHYDGRSPGRCPKDKMLARNIADPGVRPDWRVAERELVRWLKHKGFHFADRGWVID